MKLTPHFGGSIYEGRFSPSRKEVVDASIISAEELFAAAEAEFEATLSNDDAGDVLTPPSDVDAVTEHSDPAEGEDLTADDSDIEELFTLEDVEATDDEEETPPVDLSTLTFELPGVDEPVDLEELKNGYLRQSDYTRKTQALAAERQANDDALVFWEKIQTDPVSVVTSLAARLKLIPEGSTPNVDLEVAPWRTADEMEAEIEKRVTEAVEQHPQVQEARQEAQTRAITSQLDALETTYGQKLGPESRKAILTEALRRGVSDLDLIYQALSARKAERDSSKGNLKLASGQKGKGHGAAEEDAPKVFASFEDAAAEALAEFKQTG